MHSLAVSLGRQALVLKQFTINPEGEEYVHIVARKAGLFSWLLTLLGVDATTDFRVYSNRIEFQEGSLSGRIQTVLPLKSISIASCGFMKPILFLALAIICIPLAVVTMGLSLILTVLFLICYYLNKNLLISVVSNSSYPIVICFKRSVIEGVKVEYDQAQQVIQIINNLLMQQASK